MSGEVDLGQGLMPRIGEQVVEALDADGALQPVDAAEAAIVQHDDGQLQPEQHGDGDLGIHHEIGAVAEHHRHVARRVGHLDAQPAGDLVAHGGIAIFEVIAARRARLPMLVQLAGKPARRADEHVARAAARCTAPITCASEGRAVLLGAV